MIYMSKWSDDMDTILRKHAEEGRPARAAADELHMSRNAVIGRAQRLGVRFKSIQQPKVEEGRKTFRYPQHVVRSRIPTIVQEPKSLRLATEKPRDVPPDGILLTRTDSYACRRPVGPDTGLKLRVCGKTRLAGYSYCSECKPRLMYFSPRKKMRHA